MLVLFGRIKSAFVSALSRIRKIRDLKNLAMAVRASFIFMPGTCLVAAGLLIFVAPQLAVSVMAALLVVFGGAVCFLTWKLSLVKKQLEKTVKGVEARVHLRQPASPRRVQSPVDGLINLHRYDKKNTILH